MTDYTTTEEIPSKDRRLAKLSEAKKRVLSNYSIEGTVTGKRSCRGPMPDLSGKRIRQRWKVAGRKNHVWYTGSVTGQSAAGTLPSYENDDDVDTLAHYDVLYDGDECTYHVRLEKDWHNMDLDLLEVLEWNF